MRQLSGQFRDLTGDAPEGVWRSPGRVNLIGEHTDYNGGLALPFAIDRATFVAARRRPGSAVRLWSANLTETASADIGEIARWEPAKFAPWARYPLGVIWEMHERLVEVPGLDLFVSSNLPLGSGLSSSAALSVAVAVTVNDLAGARLDRSELALVAQRAEAAFAGVPCGLLDQVAVLEGKAGHGVLVNFASMTTELVPIDAGPFVIMNTRVERDNASGAYSQRREACEIAARELGVAPLCQAGLDMVETKLDGDLKKRARHVVTENARVTETVRRLRQHSSIGDLLVGSHISLRDDYEVSCPELDLAVETALANGAEGARLTGAGMGGCAISLGLSAASLGGPLASAFSAAGFKAPEVYEVAPADGADRVV
jgi:galactokinase